MRIQLGATVRTKDGHRAGEISSVVWDPDRGEVVEFVVRTAGLLGHDVRVSREVLESATAQDGDLVIDLTKDELGSLDRHDETQFAPPPYGWLAPAEATYGAQHFLFPVVAETGTEDESAPTNAAAQRPRLAIRRGMPVKDANGTKIGEVEELRIDDMTGELRAIVLRDSAATDEKTREIPADQLDVGGDEVHVIEGAAPKRVL